MPLQIPDASFRIVLGPFNGFSNGAVSSRNQPDKDAFYAKCGRDFAGVKYAQTSAGARTEIEDTPTLGDQA